MHEIVRVYFNKRGPLPWSIDYGTQETELQLAQVIFSGVYGVTVEDPANQDPEKPSAWIECYRLYTEVIDGRATLWR